MQYGFYFDADSCGDCKACIMACKDKNNTLVGSKYRNVIEFGGGSWRQEDGYMVPEGVYVYAVSVACNHCANPACIPACPQGAMKKRDDGIVFVDKEKCIGCGSCAEACPYHAPHMIEDEGVMGKCDMCADYVDEGKNPACVDACLMRCLEFGDIADLIQKYGANSDIAPLADSTITTPSLVINPSRFSGNEGAIINCEEELI